MGQEITFPHDLEIETSFLGCLLSYPEEYYTVAESLHEDLFYDSRHKFVCRAIMALRGAGMAADIASVPAWLKSQGLGADGYFVASLTNKPFFTKLNYHIISLQQHYLRRCLILRGIELSNAAQQPTCDPLELIMEQEKYLSEIINKISVGKISDALDCHIELQDHLNKIAKLKTGELIGINTGLKELNNLTAGWQKSDLIVIAARPGMGKTSLALNFARSAAESVPVGFFSLEMSKMQLYARMCSQTTSIPLGFFLRDQMSNEHRQYFNSNTFKLQNSPFYIDDRPGATLQQIKTKSRKLKRDKKIQMVIIDHLGFIGKNRSRGNTNDQIGEITSGLKGLAKELDIPILLLCQLNRESAKGPGDKKPTLVDLRDSGNIEQDADMVMLVYRPEYYGITEAADGKSTVGQAELIIAKHRNGALDSIFTGFDAKCTNFYDLAAGSAARLQPNENFLP